MALPLHCVTTTKTATTSEAGGGGAAAASTEDKEEGLRRLAAWEAGKTGYPYIDACMRQLTETGWLHHLARWILILMANYYYLFILSNLINLQTHNKKKKARGGLLFDSR
jgi:hypothetical protein